MKCPTCKKDMLPDSQGKFSHCGGAWFVWRGELRPWGVEAKFDFSDLEAAAEGRGKAA